MADTSIEKVNLDTHEDPYTHKEDPHTYICTERV